MTTKEKNNQIIEVSYDLLDFMNMTEANELTRIYNTLLLVHTSGKDTKMMS